MAPITQFTRGAPDPRVSAPVGAYLTDGKVLVQVLASAWAGVQCENVATEFLLDIGRVDLAQGWTRVRPTDSDPRGG